MSPYKSQAGLTPPQTMAAISHKVHEPAMTYSQQQHTSCHSQQAIMQEWAGYMYWEVRAEAWGVALCRSHDSKQPQDNISLPWHTASSEASPAATVATLHPICLVSAVPVLQRFGSRQCIGVSPSLQ